MNIFSRWFVSLYWSVMSLRFFVESRSGPPKPAPANCLKIFRSISAISIYRTVYGSCMYEWEVSSTRVVSPYMIQSTRHKFCTLSLNLDFQEFLSDFIISWYPTRYATCSDILHAVTMLDPWRSHLVLGSSSDRLYQIRRIVSVSVSKNKYFY